ncbi:hypothetical protein SFC55_20200 [Niallia taxi]|uniref:hypothetical protein n=1 Tax=Niallia taxi TaxID=2499688 RepID=UPI00398265EE
MSAYFNMMRVRELGIVFLALFVIGILSVDASNVRVLLFLSFFLLILVCSFIIKERIVIILIIYLALMGLIRRALIPVAGWSSFDPLLILGPSITVVMALSLFWENKKSSLIVSPKPDNLMITLFVIGCIQMVNPLSGGLTSGLIASMYIIIPWLWYFLSFYKFKQENIGTIFNVIEVIGTAIAGYGLYQTFYGILPFEQQWVDITGYAALYLAEDTVRAIGTFPSAQEFVFFTMITFMVGFSKLVTTKRYITHLPVVLITLLSIFFASSRTIIFFIALGILVVLVLSKKTILAKLITGIVAIAAFYFIWSSLTHLNPAWFGKAEPAVSHMIEGLIDPLAEDQTGIGHIERFIDGLYSIFTNPIGHGIASITKAADKSASAEAMSTEIDISNMIVAMGIGGIVYSLVILTTLYKTIYLALLNRSTETLCTIGIFIGGFGTWINGGFYTAPIVIWLLVGWVHQDYYRIRGERKCI